MKIDNEYNIGQTVYLSTDKDQNPGIITGILINPKGIQYEISQGANSSYYYPFEITEKVNVLLPLS
jgi:hypothetical protein